MLRLVIPGGAYTVLCLHQSRYR